MTSNYGKRLGSKKFATMGEKKINIALKKALKKKLIDKIPESADEQLLLLRNIAVVANNSYVFL